MRDAKASLLFRYGISVLSVLVATLLRSLLSSFLGEGVPFILYFPAVVASAWFGGLGPGLFSTALSAIGAWLFFSLPAHALFAPPPAALFQLCLFVLVSSCISAITGALHQAEARERRQREQLQVTLASIGDAMIATDQEGRITFLNNVAESLTGWSLKEAVGKPLPEVFRIINEKSRHTAENPALRAIREGRIVGLANHTILIAKDGSERPIDDSGAPIKAGENQIIGAVLVFRDISERKQLEQSLHTSEERLRLSHQVTGVGAWEWNQTTNQVFWSPEYRAIYGLEADAEPSFEKGMSVVAEEDRQPISAALAHALNSGEEYRSEHRIHHPQKGLRWILAIGRLVQDEQQSAPRLIGLAMDVTARKQAEQDRSEGAERLSLAFEAAGLGDWSWDATTNTVTLSTQVAEILGVQQTQLPWSTLREFLHEEDHAQASQAVAQALAMNSRFDIEYRVRRTGTGIAWVAAKGQATYDDLGHLRGIRGVLQDITERKLAARQIEEEREALEIINQVGRLLSAELNLHKLVQALTDAATEITGARFGSFFYNVLDERGATYMLYTLSGVPREHFEHFPMPRATDLFGPTFRGEGVIRIENVKLDARYGKNSPYFGMPEGHLPVTSYLAVPVISRSGEVLGGLFFGHPESGVFSERHERIVTGLAGQAAIAMDNARLYEAAQRAQAEAVTANRLKDEFLATVSHELRTPLNVILGWARMLRQGRLDEEARSRALGTIERSAVAQGQIIEDILDVSRIITGKLRLDVSPVEIAKVIEEAIESVRPTAEAKGVRLQAVLDTQTNLVLGDAHRLQQIMWNLLSNAIKFTPKGGRVQVTLARINSHIQILVSDTGQGISQDFLPYVFERFLQADSSTKRAYGGLGLGLAIVRHLTDLHGGNVSAYSAGEGQGATFTVSLPLSILREGGGSFDEQLEPRLHRAVAENLPTTTLELQLTGVRVLVVDDEADACELLQTILNQYGAKVRVAGSMREALEVFRQWRPDVLVSDIGMPGEDGYELIRQIRALPSSEGGGVPAAALTAYARSEDRLKALISGFQMHIAKPVEPAELVTVVASLAGKRTINEDTA